MVLILFTCSHCVYTAQRQLWFQISDLIIFHLQNNSRQQIQSINLQQSHLINQLTTVTFNRPFVEQYYWHQWFGGRPNSSRAVNLSSSTANYWMYTFLKKETDRQTGREGKCMCLKKKKTPNCGCVRQRERMRDNVCVWKVFACVFERQREMRLRKSVFA